jgi:hypothetical protein
METQWERLSGLTGVAFAVLILAALGVQGVLPNADAPADEIRAFFSDDRDAILTGVWLRFLAGFAFVWFLGTLRSALRRAEGGTGRLAAVAFGSGLVFLAAGMVSNVALAGVAFTADRAIDDGVAVALLTITHFGYIAGGMALAWLLAATFFVVLRTRVFPPLVGWTGAAIGLAAIVCGLVFTGTRAELAAHPFFVAWVLAVSVLLVRTPVEGASRPTDAAG